METLIKQDRQTTQMRAKNLPAHPLTENSMTAGLERVLVCPPQNAGWDRPERTSSWHDLGFHHAPDFAIAQSQHDALCRLLGEAGANVLCLPPSDSLTLDAIYADDASFPTADGIILMNLAKPNRVSEAPAHAEFCADLGIPMLGQIHAPACTEAGDIVWLDERTLLIGQGYRTNRAGIDQMRALLAPNEIEVISAPLPYGPGPDACLHLMSLMSMLDARTILVDLPQLAVETVELLKARDFRLIEIDYAERDTLACNVLSLGSKCLIAIDANSGTNERLRKAGFEVSTFPGSEICLNGSGGPTCLTRPLRRRLRT